MLAAEPSGGTETHALQGGYDPNAQASDDYEPVYDALQAQVHASG